MEFELLRVGHCMHPECIAMRGGRWKAIEFPALVGLIRHPARGFMLYDTGYSRHFMEATKPFPECLYRMITPPTLPLEEELLTQLEKRNIRAEQIGTILISHFHADHVAGLRDFPDACFIATREEYHEVKRKSRVKRLQRAFLSDLIPENFEDRFTHAEDHPPIDPGLHGFSDGYDLAGDGSLIGIPLPGHTRSHLGLKLTDQEGRCTLMVGDACWKMEALAERRLPSRIAARLFANNARYEETFFKLADLHARDASLKIIPSHCIATWETYGNPTQVRHE